MTPMMRISASILAALGLAACAGTRDPSEAKLFDAIGNLATGVYEEDDAAIRREIAAMEARRGEMQEEAARLAAEASRLQGQRRAAAERVGRLNAETARMNAQIAELTERERGDRARIADLRAEERALSEQVLDAATAGGDATEVDIARLEARRARLQADIDALLGIG